jgi:hypothetical protein
MSLDLQQFADFVIGPVLDTLDIPLQGAATQLLLGTAMVESNLKYIKQLGHGPALGVFQMEPATHDDVYDNYLCYNPKLELRVCALSIGGYADEMIGNMPYAAAMCMMQYNRFRKISPLPEYGDYLAMANYHKKYYNTVKGHTDVIQSAKIFKHIIDGGYA